MNNKKVLEKPEKTIIRCPQCGKRTGLRLGAGDAIVYCRHCRVDVEVIIRVIESADRK